MTLTPAELKTRPRTVWKRCLRGPLVLTIILTTWWTAGYAGDPEQVSIQTIIVQAPSYESHLVTLRGVGSDLQVTPPIPTIGLKCPLLYGRRPSPLTMGRARFPWG